MADIYEIHNKSGVSIRTLRKLEKLGFLRVSKTSDNPEIPKMLTNLRKGNALTAPQLVTLHKHPELFANLGQYEFAARNALDVLGDIAGEAMPERLAADLVFAAARDPEAVDSVARWLRAHIEAHAAYTGEGQRYPYVAVRMLANLPDALLPRNFQCIATAIQHVRKHRRMEGFSYTNEQGKTFFRKSGLDL